MTTKKQRRQAALARREEFLEDIRRSGLQAQQKDREYRERQNREHWQEQHDHKHRKTPVNECPLCQDAKKAQLQMTS